MIQKVNGIWQSSDGKRLRRISTGAVGTLHGALPGDTADSFEEVSADDTPAYTREQYRAEVERLIAERYTTGQEIQFAREKETADGYADYLAFVADCKARAIENLTNREGTDFGD